MLHDLLENVRAAAPVTAARDFHVNDDAPSDKPVVSTGARIGGYTTSSKPIVAFILLFCLMFALRALKEAEHTAGRLDRTHFRQLDLSIWNILIVSLMVIPGVAAWKFVTAKYLNPDHPLRTLVWSV